MPACAQMKASLPHSTVLMLGDNSASKPACSHQASRRRALRLVRPSSSPNVMLGQPAAMHDHTRLGDPSKNESSPAHHVVFPDRAGEFLLIFDAVLQRHHRRILTHQWPQPGRGGVGIEGLDAEQHNVARANLGRVIGGRNLHLEVALDTADPNSALAKGLQVSASRDEVHLLLRPGPAWPPKYPPTPPAP